MWRWRGDSGGIAWRSFGDHVEMVGRWWEDGGEMVERSSRCAVWAVPPMHQKLQPYVREVATLYATPCRDPYAFSAATLCAHRPRPTAVLAQTSPPPQTLSGGREATSGVNSDGRVASRSNDSHACSCPPHRRRPRHRHRRSRRRSRYRRRRRRSRRNRCRHRRRRSRRRCAGRAATRRDSGYRRPSYCNSYLPRARPARHHHHHHRHLLRDLHQRQRQLAGRPGYGSVPAGWRAPTRSSHPSYGARAPG